MVEVKLREYCEEIEGLIDQGSIDAAIGHCQHILKAYPKYLTAYSLIGKAALEKGDLAAAADLFSRQLSMDPEDFVARVGMSIASDKDGSLDQAVWHMERAFELAPDNQAVISELRRLHGRREGMEPDKVPLTRGALARLYARGSLCTRAISELRQLLQAEPHRVDLQVILAETLWRADRRIEAVEVSLAVLEKLPHCLKGNLILGEIWSSSGREVEGAAHLERAQMIDPENEAAQILFGERSPLSPVDVLIERMEYIAPAVPVEPEPDWLQTLVEEGTSPAAADEAIPDWLQAVAASAEAEVPSAPDTAISEAAQPPDWLQEVAATADIEAEEFAFAPEEPAPALAEGEMPDWLDELTAEPSETVAEPLAPDEIPGWLDEIPVPPTEELEEAPSEIPDWLTETAIAEAEAAEEPEVAPGELPDWLTEVAAAEAELAEEPEVAPGELPDWLADMAPTEEQLADVEDLGLAPAEIPEWLAEMAPPEAAPPSMPELDVAPAEVPDWLAEAEQPEAEAPAVEPVEEEAVAAPPPSVAAETTDWLSELVVAAGATMEEGEAPAEELVEAEEAIAPEIEEPAIPTRVEEAEADLMARIEDMSPEEAFAAWEAMLAEAELEEAEPTMVEAPEAAGPIVTEEPEKEALVYPEAEEGKITEAEADLMARIEDMSPEEAFAAWEAMLAEAELEEAEAAVVEAPEAAGPIVTEEPEKEALVYPEVEEGAITEAEADLMARIEDMSPEEAFAAWEATLAEAEFEEAEPTMVEAPEAAGPIVTEEPEKEALVYPEAEEGAIAEAEADLMARIEEMSPEEAFAAWEAMLAESEEQVPEEEAPSPEVVAEAEEAWMALFEDEGAEEIEAPEVPEELPAEPLAALDQEKVALIEEAPPVEPVSEEGPAWMTLAEDEVSAMPAEKEVELPDWAVVEAIETVPEAITGAEAEVVAGPDLVLLTEEEETQVSVREEREDLVPADLSELGAEVKELVEEEVAPEAEAPPTEPELLGRPTWVALEEEPVDETVAAEALAIGEEVAEPEDDQERLELARRLWAARRREEARDLYERLLTTPLRDDVTADLESIDAQGSAGEPILRLLGDAYMKADRLQDALDAYRRALVGL